MRGRSRKGPNPLARVYESNGPDVKIRGTASHVMEKYLSLARDAQASGDPVSAENYLQHAEHYYRIIAGAQQQPVHPGYQPSFYQGDEGREDDWEGGEDSRFASYPDRQPANGFVPNGGMRHSGHEQPYPRQPAPMAQDERQPAAPGEALASDSGPGEPGPQGQPDEGGFRRPRRRGRYQRGDRRPQQQGGETPAAEPAPVD